MVILWLLSSAGGDTVMLLCRLCRDASHLLLTSCWSLQKYMAAWGLQKYIAGIALNCRIKIWLNTVEKQRWPRVEKPLASGSVPLVSGRLGSKLALSLIIKGTALGICLLILCRPGIYIFVQVNRNGESRTPRSACNFFHPDSRLRILYLFTILPVVSLMCQLSGCTLPLLMLKPECGYTNVLFCLKMCDTVWRHFMPRVPCWLTQKT